MPSPPLIGLTGYHIHPAEPVGGHVRGQAGQEFSLISLDYVEGIRRCGGVPVALPIVRDELLLRVAVERLDGLVLTGGEDLDPWVYGQMPSPRLGRVDPARDEFELALADLAFQAGLPVLAICRGMQLVNVLLGGTLHQDVGSGREPAIDHAGPHGPRWYRVHDVLLQAGSALHELFGADRIRTNSFHHQAVDRPGRGLRVVAHAPDGVIEGLALDQGEDFLGVQWHPEMMAPKFDEGLIPFRWLIGRAARRQTTAFLPKA